MFGAKSGDLDSISHRQQLFPCRTTLSRRDSLLFFMVVWHGVCSAHIVSRRDRRGHSARVDHLKWSRLFTTRSAQCRSLPLPSPSLSILSTFLRIRSPSLPSVSAVAATGPLSALASQLPSYPAHHGFVIFVAQLTKPLASKTATTDCSTHVSLESHSMDLIRADTCRLLILKELAHSSWLMSVHRRTQHGRPGGSPAGMTLFHYSTWLANSDHRKAD